MSKEFSAKELSDFLYYRKLPEVYRMADEESTEKKDLYRYISALIEGAFDDTLVKAAEMKNLVDPWKVNKDILPLLYKAWGIPYFVSRQYWRISTSKGYDGRRSIHYPHSYGYGMFSPLSQRENRRKRR